MPSWVKILATVAFMDFMLYIWHLLNHEVPFFWRFHRVHHSDLNMDVSTATRFHVGELALSAVIKIGLVFFMGASVTGVVIFESALVLCAQFHHSSLKVPWWFERIFWVFFVPPSMHRIHHSVIISERDTNYGTILSIWDRLLGTLLTDVDQARIRIGVGAYQKPERLNFQHLMVMPFTRAIK
jgi:sterol desaturase/sphingolipid hydroxylase (fatty acid hydroxylase superfamily)